MVIVSHFIAFLVGAFAGMLVMAMMAVAKKPAPEPEWEPDRLEPFEEAFLREREERT
jgi:hypothetical protein